MVIATLALLAGALFYPPLASTHSGEPTLSSTPPVALAPTSTTPTSTTTTTTAQPRLPKTGFETSILALLGVGLLAAGTALRRARPAPGLRRTR